MKVNQYLKLIQEGYIGPHKNFTPQKLVFTCIRRCTTDCPAYRSKCNFKSRYGVEVSHTAVALLVERLVDYPEFFI